MGHAPKPHPPEGWFPREREFSVAIPPPWLLGVGTVLKRAGIAVLLGPLAMLGIACVLKAAAQGLGEPESVDRLNAYLFLAGVPLGFALSVRPIRRYLKLRAFLRAVRGKELLVDRDAMQLCRAYVSMAGFRGFPARDARALDATPNPYVRIGWLDIRRWRNVQQGDEIGPKQRAFKVTLRSTEEPLLIDRAYLGEAEKTIVELVKQRTHALDED